MAVAADHPAREKVIRALGITAALRSAARRGYFPRARSHDAEGCKNGSDYGSLTSQPLSILYDLDVWDGMLKTCADAFGPGCMHTLAIKGSPITALMKRAVEVGFGLECASIGEVVHAQAAGCPPERIVFDSPCKTHAEIKHALQHGMHVNLDNFEELRRCDEIRCGLPTATGNVGLRLNPLCGTGTIAALSVSVADSKFGVSRKSEAEFVAAFRKYQWLNCVHVHVGSGGMGTSVLVEGVRIAVDLAMKINEKVGRRQVTVMDIGGGLSAGYASDEHPAFKEYTTALRQNVPGLLRGGDCSVEPLFDQVITEFGQALAAKTGFVASRIQYMKETADNAAQIAISHIGADLCVRQCYTQQHKRRVEFYDADTCAPITKRRKSDDDAETGDVQTHVGGPLCFQGDFIAKDLSAPPLRVDDFVVMREGGSNTLALFSRHCSRMAPVVLGYRLLPSTNDRADGAGSEGGADVQVLKPQETLESVCAFWGAPAPVEQ